MEIITGLERRRCWRVADKLRIVAQTEQPEVGFAEIARRHEISRALLWSIVFEANSRFRTFRPSGDLL
jgi:transposase